LAGGLVFLNLHHHRNHNLFHPAITIKPESRSWRTIMQGFGSGSGEELAGKSGDKSHAVQTLRAGRAATNFAPAFGLRVLEHRLVPHGNNASL